MRRKEIVYVAKCDENTCNAINEKIKAVIRNGGGLVKEVEMWERKMGNLNDGFKEDRLFCRIGGFFKENLLNEIDLLLKAETVVVNHLLG